MSQAEVEVVRGLIDVGGRRCVEGTDARSTLLER